MYHTYLSLVDFTTLQHTATHPTHTLSRTISSLVRTLTYCNTMQHIATYCKTPVIYLVTNHLFPLAHLTHCNTLQHTASHCNSSLSHCNSLQHATKHCHTLQHTQRIPCHKPPPPSCALQHTAIHCNTLQYTVTHCNTLQHTATRCNTPTTYLVTNHFLPLAHLLLQVLHGFFVFQNLFCLSIKPICIAVSCSELQCVSESFCLSIKLICVGMLQCVAVCCSVFAGVLQYIAVCCLIFSVSLSMQSV